MNHFFKQIGAGVRKPATRLTPTGAHELRLFTVPVELPGFLYNNENLFHKPVNSVDTVLKALAVASSFREEWEAVRALARALQAAGVHVTDVFFSPVGWMAGTAPPPGAHAAVRVVAPSAAAAARAVKQTVKALRPPVPMAPGEAREDAVVEVQEFSSAYAGHGAPPVGVMAACPFDQEASVLVLFFGRTQDAHCGIAYRCATRTETDRMLATLLPIVSEMHVVCDDVGRSTVSRHRGGGAATQFPDDRVTSIVGVVHPFDHRQFPSAPSASPSSDLVLYAPKRFVFVVDLPSGVDIRCASRSGTDFVTHIDGRKLDAVLVIVKDAFMAGVTMDGVFQKENLVWRGKYTYRITKSSFEVPEFRGKAGGHPPDGRVLASREFVTRSLYTVL
ncbi:telomere-binding protein [Pseudocowpox virus]|uniref:Telomere-binding protein n=1 Tax=Pseudocowpox virus TaxID=129726 RepID=D3IZI1_9POXV|nr:telomere-binding protein [Pseudocowpox virus]ADC53935.1 telomere-binding protein [Pseudocowpox virus]